MSDIVLQTSAGNFFVSGQQYTINDFLQGAGEILLNVRETGNWQLLGNTIKSLVGFSQASGKALAYLVSGGKSIWVENGGSERDFYNMIHVQSGVTRETLERYSETWSALQQVPEEYKDRMLEQPIRSLIHLGSAIEQGIVPNNEGWQKLTEAQTYHEFLAVLHDEGLPTRKSFVQLVFDQKSGDIYAYSNGQQIFIGYLDISQDSDVATKACNRIIRASGMKVKES